MYRYTYKPIYVQYEYVLHLHGKRKLQTESLPWVLGVALYEHNTVEQTECSVFPFNSYESNGISNEICTFTNIMSVSPCVYPIMRLLFRFEFRNSHFELNKISYSNFIQPFRRSMEISRK